MLESEAKLIRHVLYEARLAAAGRPLQQHRKSAKKSGTEDFDLVADRQIKRFMLDPIFFDWQLSCHCALRHDGRSTQPGDVYRRAAEGCCKRLMARKRPARNSSINSRSFRMGRSNTVAQHPRPCSEWASLPPLPRNPTCSLTATAMAFSRSSVAPL